MASRLHIIVAGNDDAGRIFHFEKKGNNEKEMLKYLEPSMNL